MGIFKMNCIKELHIVPNIVNPSPVSIQSSGKKQLILDLRHMLFIYKNSCEIIERATLRSSHLNFLTLSSTSSQATIKYYRPKFHGFLVSKETVVLCRWGSSKQKFGLDLMDTTLPPTCLVGRSLTCFE